MVQSWLHWMGRAIQLHPDLTYLFGFLTPIAGAYWLFSVKPYTRPDVARLLSPWHVRRPAVPGVLERYASWEWAAEDQLTPFGRWLLQELARQDETLSDLLQRADLDMHAVAPVMFAGEGEWADPAVIRRLAALVGADEKQIQWLQRAQQAAGRELNRLS